MLALSQLGRPWPKSTQFSCLLVWAQRNLQLPRNQNWLPLRWSRIKLWLRPTVEGSPQFVGSRLKVDSALSPRPESRNELNWNIVNKINISRCRCCDLLRLPRRLLIRESISRRRPGEGTNQILWRTVQAFRYISMIMKRKLARAAKYPAPTQAHSQQKATVGRTRSCLAISQGFSRVPGTAISA